MKKYVLLVMIIGFFANNVWAEATSSTDTTFASFDDFLDSVNAAPESLKMEIVDSFMVWAVQSGFPFIEDSMAHFIYRGIVTSQIAVAGDFNSWNYNVDKMTDLAGTDFYYRTKVFPLDARLDYKFVRDGTWMLDPLNPNTCAGGYGPNSELSMPDYVPPPEVKYYPDIPHGTIDTFKFHSGLLDNDHWIYVYLPPNYSNSSESFPSMYVQDGSDYICYAKINRVMDYLLYEQKIGPILVVLIKPINRNVEYALNTEYESLITSELVPYVDSVYKPLNDSEYRGIMGASFGGLISVFIAYNNSTIFGKCAGQSNYFGYNNNQMIDIIGNGEFRDISFYLDCGTFETGVSGVSLIDQNRQMRDALLAKGYNLTYNEYNEGHSWCNWRAHIDEILKAFWPNVVGIEKNDVESKGPVNYLTLQNYPNPFSSFTTIRCLLTTSAVDGQPTAVSLRLFDLSGRLIKTFDLTNNSKGFDGQSPVNEVVWDGKDDHGRKLKSGVYLCRFKIRDSAIVRKVTFIR